MQFNVEHLGVAARDPVGLAEWYARVLGAAHVFECDNPGKPPTRFLRLPGGLVLEIYPTTHHLGETGTNSLAGWRHLALQVASVEAARGELERRGVSFSETIKPAGGGGRVLFFQDPEGNLLHFVERPANLVFATSGG